MSPETEAALLNVTQQALRTLMVALATAAKADWAVLAEALQAGADNPQLEAEAKLMLDDLALGAAALARALR